MVVVVVVVAGMNEMDSGINGILGALFSLTVRRAQPPAPHPFPFPSIHFLLDLSFFFLVLGFGVFFFFFLWFAERNLEEQSAILVHGRARGERLLRGFALDSRGELDLLLLVGVLGVNGE
jgi:hypothetical protein